MSLLHALVWAITASVILTAGAFAKVALTAAEEPAEVVWTMTIAIVLGTAGIWLVTNLG